MIRSISLQKLRNSEFIQFFIDLISIFTKNKPEELGIKEQLDPLTEEVEKTKLLYGAAKGSEISGELKSIDDSRDDCITGIHTVAEGFSYHYDSAIKEAAELILNKIDSYGTSIARQNYPTETISLDGISEAFINEEKLKNALTLLNLTEWALKMKEENDLFNQQYLNRVDETAQKTEDKMKKLRKTITEKYYTLRDHFTAHATIKANENYKTVANQFNILIDEYNSIIKKRKNKDNQDDTNNSPDPDKI